MNPSCIYAPSPAHTGEVAHEVTPPPNGLGHPSVAGHHSVATPYGIVNSAGSYAVPSQHLQFWTVPSQGGPISLIPAPQGYNRYGTTTAAPPNTSTTLMYMPVPSGNVGAHFAPSSLAATTVPSYASPPPQQFAAAVPVIASEQWRMERDVVRITPNTVLPAGVPFCPRGVPPTEEYCRS